MKSESSIRLLRLSDLAVAALVVNCSVGFSEATVMLLTQCVNQLTPSVVSQALKVAAK